MSLAMLMRVKWRSMSALSRHNTVRYGIAIGFTLLALILRIVLAPWVHGASPFVFFTPVVMLSAWYGGWGPGFLATILGGALGNYFLLDPPLSFSLGGHQGVRMLLFLIISIQISWLSGAMHSARRRAEQDAREVRWARDNLEQRVRERTAELRFQKTLLECQSQASVDGILAIGNDGKLIFANDRFRELWQLSPGESLATFDEIRLMLRERLEALQVDPLSADAPQFALSGGDNANQLLLKNGQTLEQYSASIIDPDGQSYGRVWFFRNMTERKRMQREVLEAGERERQRIGQDLHDDLCQQLTGIACMGQALQQELAVREDARSKSESRALKEIVAMIERATQRARDLAKGLQPLNLARQGLRVAMHELCGSIEMMFQISCRFEGEDPGEDVEPAASLQLYRIAQEAVSNAIRHGKAKNIRLDLAVAGGRLIMTVEDDGVGISQPVQPGGLGLLTMNYRARLVGGALSVEPTASGTIVTCSVPLRSMSSVSAAVPLAESV
jgi:signal transduction histidine kinase